MESSQIEPRFELLSATGLPTKKSISHVHGSPVKGEPVASSCPHARGEDEEVVLGWAGLFRWTLLADVKRSDSVAVSRPRESLKPPELVSVTGIHERPYMPGLTRIPFPTELTADAAGRASSQSVRNFARRCNGISSRFLPFFGGAQRWGFVRLGFPCRRGLLWGTPGPKIAHTNVRVVRQGWAGETLECSRIRVQDGMPLAFLGSVRYLSGTTGFVQLPRATWAWAGKEGDSVCEEGAGEQNWPEVYTGVTPHGGKDR